ESTSRWRSSRSCRLPFRFAAARANRRAQQCARHLGLRERGAVEHRIPEIRLAAQRLEKIGAARAGPAQVGLHEMRIGKQAVVEEGAAQVALSEIAAQEARAAEIGVGEGR